MPRSSSKAGSSRASSSTKIELTKAELEELCRKAAQEAYKEGVEAGKKEASATKSKYKLDHSRKMGPDERDPRHLGE